MPDAQSTCLSASDLRRHGFTDLIGATSRHHDEERLLLEAGVDMTFLTHEESGVGLAEHVVEAMGQTQPE